jgi:iron complex outermembrane receptor protein
MSSLRALVGALLLTVAGAAGAPVVQAQQQASITGTVRNEAGKPVVGARVTARGAVERSARTDAAGGYRLRALPAGRYGVRVEALGYGSVEREVQATATMSEDFTLAAEAVALAPLQVVAAMRTGTSAAALPIKVEVVHEAELAQQRTLASNPTEILSNLIPSFSPARQKLSTAGESFRGRRPLFLIDGVPQSNPLRDGRRDAFTIDMENIERVEVVFGANAIQGLGATGGIVNYVTVSPPLSGELEQRASVSTTSSDELQGDGMGWRAHYLAAKRFGAVDAVGSVSYEHRGLQFDARNRPIALDNVQGDISDSHSYDLFGKVGWEPTPAQRLQLTVNHFRLAQEGDFDSRPGDRELGVPAVSVAGRPEGVTPINDVTTASLDYEHSGVGGGTLSAKAYYQDFSALFGGGRFDTFQDPQIAPVGEVFDQSENDSEKLGTRLTYARSRLAGSPLDLITGFDFLRDRTYQRLVNTNRNWVPETSFFNYAPFAQLDLRAPGWLTLSGGLRWEIASLDVPEFTTLAGNRADFQRLQVAGGSPSFDEPLWNVGAVVTPVSGLRFYGTFAQAYTMPDVGRVLRGVSKEGTAVDDFLELTPIKTDNLEAGGSIGGARGSLGATYFESKSDLGSRLVPNADGIFQVRREPTRTSGWELTGRYDPTSLLSLGAGYSLLKGSYDGDGDGHLESDLGAADIGPDRLNLTLDVNRGGRLSGRIQSSSFFDRSFRDGSGAVTARFDGYHTLDTSLSAALGGTTLTLSVANLLDAQYITYFGQAATDLDDRYFAGRGRTLTLRAERRF